MCVCFPNEENKFDGDGQREGDSGAWVEEGKGVAKGDI